SSDFFVHFFIQIVIRSFFSGISEVHSNVFNRSISHGSTEDTSHAVAAPQSDCPTASPGDCGRRPRPRVCDQWTAGTAASGRRILRPAILSRLGTRAYRCRVRSPRTAGGDGYVLRV